MGSVEFLICKNVGSEGTSWSSKVEGKMMLFLLLFSSLSGTISKQCIIGVRSPWWLYIQIMKEWLLSSNTPSLTCFFYSPSRDDDARCRHHPSFVLLLLHKQRGSYWRSFSLVLFRGLSRHFSPSITIPRPISQCTLVYYRSLLGARCRHHSSFFFFSCFIQELFSLSYLVQRQRFHLESILHKYTTRQKHSSF